MDIPMINIEPERARAELAHFAQLRDEQRQVEDDAFIKAYRAIAKGHSLLDIAMVMEHAGCDEETALPKLAIARAHEPMVYYRHRFGPPTFTTALDRWGQAPDFAPHWRHCTKLPQLKDVWPGTPQGQFGSETYMSAVPIVPPEHRPRWKLSNYHILWEVDEWDVAPAGDPLLLRHCGGTLFAILAAWDLTPLETAILNRRFVQ